MAKKESDKTSETTPFLHLTAEEVESLDKRLRERTLSQEDFETLRKVLQALVSVRMAYARGRLTLLSFLRKFFGNKTEKEKTAAASETPKPSDKDSKSGNPNPKKNEDPAKTRGGRNGRDDYPGAEKKECKHESLASGDQCPECGKGKLVPVEPAVEYGWKGTAPVSLTVFLLERFVCSICAETFTAKGPSSEEKGPEVDTSHPDDPLPTARADHSATANAMVALLRYLYGVASYRLAKMQGRMGLTLPESTQWRMIQQVKASCAFVFDQLMYEAAQGDLVKNDDTRMQVLDIIKEASTQSEKAGENAARGAPERRSTRTSTVISKTAEGHTIVLYLTGRAIAGENLAEILKLRDPSLPPPLHMCDGSSQSLVKEHKVEQLHCLTHARRKFYDLYKAGKKDLGYVIDLFGKIYFHDNKTTEMTPKERMEYLKRHTQETVDTLKEWMEKQLNEQKVEPNSALGTHITYCLKRWPELTKFLSVPGVPLTNDETERKIKAAIVHRKNSLFYKTENGADTGDIIMSLAETCAEAGENPFEYFVALQQHRSKVIANPKGWMPWNWKKNFS